MNIPVLVAGVVVMGSVWFVFLASIAPLSSYSLSVAPQTAAMLASCYGRSAFARLDFTWPSALLSAT